MSEIDKEWERYRDRGRAKRAYDWTKRRAEILVDLWLSGLWILLVAITLADSLNGRVPKSNGHVGVIQIFAWGTLLVILLEYFFERVRRLHDYRMSDRIVARVGEMRKRS